MKLIFEEGAGGLIDDRVATAPWRVECESDRLTDVVLGAPTFLEAVPCCSVTRETLREGFATDRAVAVRQHAALVDLLERHGVACHVIPAAEGLADLCFARDVAVTTPWGLVALNPALAHRSVEVDHLVATLAAQDIRPVMRIREGMIEGGDVCIVRPGLVVIGCSGERTDRAGSEALARLFRRRGWEAIIHPFDPHFLHLDTIFCMLDRQTALACTDVLSDGFIAEMEGRGITLLPVSYKEGRKLGCNILSLDGRTILAAAGHPRVEQQLVRAGFAVEVVDISQFAACGGGIHCLTMPLARAARR
ncbi:MAG: arginine deiminase family protein [Sphingomonas sp.]